jgi:putative phosphoesterase
MGHGAPKVMRPHQRRCAAIILKITFDRMKRIGLLSDTHSWLDDRILHHLSQVDEIWHAGDIGAIDLSDRLSKVTQLRAVWGNIDNAEVRITFDEHLHFVCEELRVYITHIGGYPGRYSPMAYKEIIKHKPSLFICGHSHILKVMADPKLGLMHMNPGAAGISGFHKVRTLLRFCVTGQRIHDVEVVELGKRGSAQAIGAAH